MALSFPTLGQVTQLVFGKERSIFFKNKDFLLLLRTHLLLKDTAEKNLMGNHSSRNEYCEARHLIPIDREEIHQTRYQHIIRTSLYQQK
jgi:hypothetical protein